MNRCVRAAGISLWVMAAVVRSAPAQSTTETEQVTIITADRLEFDHKKQYAQFTNNVVVTDPQLSLSADELVVRFTSENKVSVIQAKGHVIIEQEDRKAWAGHAIYEVESGQIQLSVKPRVQRGQDILTGNTIPFWRDQEKMICDGRAQLVIYPDKGGSRQVLGGE